MDLSLSSSLSSSLSRNHSSLYFYKASSLPNSRYPTRPLSNFPNQDLKPRISLRKSLFSRHSNPIRAQNPDQAIDDGFFIEDVPHLTNFLPNLPSYPNPLHRSPAYAIVKQTFVNPEDVVAGKIVVQKNSPRGVHFRRAGPRERVYFKSEEVRACIVTCGGLCPGINTVIREIVCGLNSMYGVGDILGIEDCCLIPESPFYLEGQGGLFEFIEQRLKENGHMVICWLKERGRIMLLRACKSSMRKMHRGIGCF